MTSKEFDQIKAGLKGMEYNDFLLFNDVIRFLKTFINEEIKNKEGELLTEDK